MRRYRRRGRRLNARGKFVLAFLILLVVAVFADIQLRPLIKTVAANQAQMMSIDAINEAVTEELSRQDVDYSDLVRVERDGEGKILAVQTDTVKMNQLKASIGESIQRKLQDTRERSLRIPLGTLLGIELLRDRGPEIPIKVTLAGSVASQFKSSLATAGINQSKHQISLEIHTSIYVLIPGYNVSTEVDTNVAVAETVIVGDVPEVFASLDGANASDVADFAQLRKGE